MSTEAGSCDDKHKWTVDARFVLLLVFAFSLGIGVGVSLAHRYSAYNVGNYVLYRIDHLTGQVSLCRPVSGVGKCEDVKVN